MIQNVLIKDSGVKTKETRRPLTQCSATAQDDNDCTPRVPPLLLTASKKQRNVQKAVCSSPPDVRNHM